MGEQILKVADGHSVYHVHAGHQVGAIPHFVSPKPFQITKKQAEDIKVPIK